MFPQPPRLLTRDTVPTRNLLRDTRKRQLQQYSRIAHISSVVRPLRPGTLPFGGTQKDGTLTLKRPAEKSC